MLGSLVCEATFPCVGLDMMSVNFAIIPVAPAVVSRTSFWSGERFKSERAGAELLHYLHCIRQMASSNEVFFVPIAPAAAPPPAEAEEVVVTTAQYWALLPFAEDGRNYIPLCEKMFDATVLAYLLSQAAQAANKQDERSARPLAVWRVQVTAKYLLDAFLNKTLVRPAATYPGGRHSRLNCDLKLPLKAAGANDEENIPMKVDWLVVELVAKPASFLSSWSDLALHLQTGPAWKPFFWETKSDCRWLDPTFFVVQSGVPVFESSNFPFHILQDSYPPLQAEVAQPKVPTYASRAPSNLFFGLLFASLLVTFGVSLGSWVVLGSEVRFAAAAAAAAARRRFCKAGKLHALSAVQVQA